MKVGAYSTARSLNRYYIDAVKMWDSPKFKELQMNRKFALGIALLSIWTLARPLGSIAIHAAPRPNIILIMVDDMGFADIGPYGSEIQTPTLSRLSKNGVRFTQFYNTGRCCPTRASLMSGLYPHQAGVGHMTDDRGTDGYRGDLNRRSVTIAEVLQQAGYGTYMSGKWHLTKSKIAKDEAGKQNWPPQRGFDRFFGTIAGAGSFWTPATLTRDNTTIDQNFPKDFYYTDAISDNTAKFITEHQRGQADKTGADPKPFFCYVAYTAPHWPLHAREKDIARYRGKYMMGWDKLRQQRFATQKEMGLALDSWKLSPRMPGMPAWDSLDESKKKTMDQLMAVYAAMITVVDEGVGRIVKTLETTGQLDNTLIFFLADNGGCAEGGPLGGERIMIKGASVGGPGSDPRLGGAWANANDTPFRYWKHYVHEGGASTPLIVHWPGGITKEHRNQFRRQPGHLIDIMATCVDVSGAKYPAQYKGKDIQPMEGCSLVPALAGKTIEREAIYWEHEGHCAIRVGNWKLVSLKRGEDWELYDISKDRSELNDLASQQPDRVKQMSKQWNVWAKRANVIPWPQKKTRAKPKKNSKKKNANGKKKTD
jgi:arylsulfatase A-like enzyme